MNDSNICRFLYNMTTHRMSVNKSVNYLRKTDNIAQINKF